MWIPKLLVASTTATLDVPLVLSSDHKSPAPAGTVPTLVKIRKSGAASWATPAGAFAEVGSGAGRFRVGATGSGTDLDTRGPLALHVEATGCDPSNWVYFVASYEAEEPYVQHSRAWPFPFFVAAAGTATGLAGATVSVSLQKPGGAFAAATGVVSELGGAGNGFGWYELAPSAADVDTAGVLVLRPSAAGGEAADYEFDLVPGVLAGTATDLVEVMAEALQADAATVALSSGGVWIDQAPRGAAVPYLVLSGPERPRGYESPASGGTADYFADGPVQLSAFTTGRNTSRALARTASTALDVAALVHGEGDFVDLWPGEPSTALDDEKGPGGADIWHTTVRFRAVTHGPI